MKRSLLSGCVLLLLLLAAATAATVVIVVFFFFTITPLRWSMHANVCVNARVTRGKKIVREIDKQNESNGIEEKSDYVAKRYAKRNRFGKSPLEKFVDFPI